MTSRAGGTTPTNARLDTFLPSALPDSVRALVPFNGHYMQSNTKTRTGILGESWADYD